MGASPYMLMVPHPHFYTSSPWTNPETFHRNFSCIVYLHHFPDPYWKVVKSFFFLSEDWHHRACWGCQTANLTCSFDCIWCGSNNSSLAEKCLGFKTGQLGPERKKEINVGNNLESYFGNVKSVLKKYQWLIVGTQKY